MSAGWIGVDLDGTLAYYDGWRGITYIGKPIEPMVDRIKVWLAAGIDVRIFTARMAEPSQMQRSAFVQALHGWLRGAGLPTLGVTNVKDFGMIELWDDRAVQVTENTGVAPIGSQRGFGK